MNDKQIIICDIDGTIANLQHRLHYIRNPEEAEINKRIATLSSDSRGRNKFPNIGTKAQQEIDELKERKEKFRKDWDSFHVTCIDDEPYRDVIRILWDLYDAGRRIGQEGSSREVYFFSGRNESVRSETIRWLWKHVLSPSMCHSVEITKEEYDELANSGMGHTVHSFGEDPTNTQWPQGYIQLQPNLCMRSEGDRRPDTTVKYEMMYDYKFMPEDVLCILDDRQGVVDMWRENGFRCLQVDAWKEPPQAHTWGGGKSALLDQHQPTMPTPRTLDVATKNLSEIEENNNES